jgi:prevent-host-death family protein
VDSITAIELNQQITRVLDRVRAGESLEIIEHGRSIARLLPVMPPTGVPLLDGLIAQGRAVPAANPGPIPPTPPWDAAEESPAFRTGLTDLSDDER